MKNILEEQNSEKNLKLLVTQRVLYSKAKHFRFFELAFLSASVIISLLPIVPINYLRDSPEYYFSIISTIFFLISFFMVRLSKNNQEKAASVQQQFDCGLFNLVYGHTVSNEDILRISDEAISKDSGIKEQVRNWYTDAISKFDFPYSALACQQQNIGWNISLSKRYLKFLFFSSFLLLTPIIIIIGFKWNVIRPIFYSDFSNAYNFLIFFISIIKTPVSRTWDVRNEIREKEEFIKDKYKIFSDISANDINHIPHILEEVQSNIFRFRKNHKPIPDFFYKLHKYKEEARSRKRLE